MPREGDVDFPRGRFVLFALPIQKLKLFQPEIGPLWFPLFTVRKRWIPEMIMAATWA